MDIVIYTAPLFLGFLVSLFLRLPARVSFILAKTTLGLAIFYLISIWIYYFAGIKDPGFMQIMALETRWEAIIMRVVYGYLLGYLTFGHQYVADEGGRAAIWRNTLWAATIMVAGTFITATIGKSMNMSYMISFFKQSGYAVWFLYFIMTAETAGAIGVLLHFKLKTGVAAAIGLLIIMMGAVYTHWHNGDPFSDSYAAVDQLVAESLLLYLYFLGRRTAKAIPAIS